MLPSCLKGARQGGLCLHRCGGSWYFPVCVYSLPQRRGCGHQRCAYVGDYKCYNAAKVDDEKYPPIDGKEYCKIHWKALSGVKE